MKRRRTTRKAKVSKARIPFNLDIPSTLDDCYGSADWLEMRMLVRGDQQISRAELLEFLAAEMNTVPQAIESEVAFMMDEIVRRRELGGKNYPFCLEENLIKIDATADAEFYKFLLLLSLEKSPLRKTKKYNTVDFLFDDVVAEAVIGYLGKNTETLRFGSPSRNGRPTRFATALDWLAGLIGIPSGPNKGKPTIKDGGLDVIAWKKFDDERMAFAVMLIQCTIQREWFIKANDIDANVWDSRIQFNRSPMSALAIPFIIPVDYDNWGDLRCKVSVMFDRLRLIRCLENSSSTKFLDMRKWVEKELKKFITV